MKKLFYCILLVLNIFFISSCSNSEVTRNEYLFRIDEATDFGKEYIKNLAEDESKNIQAYLLKEVTEGSNYVVLTYRIVRNDTNNINSSLDEFKLKVSKNDEDYFVSELKSDNVSEVYLDKNSLRIINKDTGLSELLIRLKDMPREVYPQDSNIMINKENVKNEEYEKLAIDEEGKKIGSITKVKDKHFICLIQAEDTKETVGEVNNDTNEASDNISDFQNFNEISEMPIASKITAYDLISSNKIEKLIFSSDGNYLLLQSNENNKSRLHIYKNPNGEKLDFNLDEVFPKDKYSINIKLVNEDGVFISAKDSNSDNIYRLDLKNKKIFSESKEK